MPFRFVEGEILSDYPRQREQPSPASLTSIVRTITRRRER